MTIISQPSTIADRLILEKPISWYDSDTECILVVSQPTIDADLWYEYSAGAQRSYRKHGVESALDLDALRTGTDTIAYLAAIDATGRMVAGVRAIGPLRSADDSHAVVEWAGQPGQQTVRKMIADRIPFGVLEMKSAWVADREGGDRSLTAALARSGFHLMALFGAEFCLATAAAYVLNRWRTSGGVVAAVPATPYPDERYQTKMMWWHRRDFVKCAAPDQAVKIFAETKYVAQELDRSLSRRDETGGTDAMLPNWGVVVSDRIGR